MQMLVSTGDEAAYRQRAFKKDQSLLWKSILVFSSHPYSVNFQSNPRNSNANDPTLLSSAGDLKRKQLDENFSPSFSCSDANPISPNYQRSSDNKLHWRVGVNFLRGLTCYSTRTKIYWSRQCSTLNQFFLHLNVKLTNTRHHTPFIQFISDSR